MTWEIKQKGIDRFLVSVGRALNDEDEFRKFRRDQDIRGIIDGVTASAGRSYLRKIEAIDPEWIRRHWSDIALNDLVGCPDRIRFLPSGHVRVSPTCMRYAWQAFEVDRKFSLTGKRIIEIGGGYGGLARIICGLFAPASYSIIDIPQVSSLARKYLEQFDLSTPFHFPELDSNPLADVVIANYSIAELDRTEQLSYLDRIILPASAAYIVHNIPSPSSKQLSRHEFEDILKAKFDVESYVEGVERSEQSKVFICVTKKSENSDAARSASYLLLSP